MRATRRYDGVTFAQPMAVSHVGCLWFGLQVPPTPHSAITFSITLHFDGGLQDQTVDVTLTSAAGAPPLSAHGDRDPTRLARLRWLDSSRGLDFNPSAAYDPVTFTPASGGGGGGGTITIKNRVFELAPSGFFSSVKSNGMEMLDGPIQLLVRETHNSAAVELKPTSAVRVTRLGPGVVSWAVSATGADVMATLVATLSYDGYVGVLP
jgi:hypothetical protein